MAVDAAFVLEPEPDPWALAAHAETSVDSYRRLAATFHAVLAEQDLEPLLDRIAGTLADLVPYHDLHIYEADEGRRELVPVFARGPWQREVLETRIAYGQGITGWAVVNREPVLANDAHLDPRVEFVPGTPPDPEALITVPLVARGALKGALNIYRVGEEASFDQDEFELARWFGDAAALALDNARIRARLERLAQTDSLTGLYNHRHFHERLRGELHRAGRVRDTVALLMVDIDDFKRVNDVCGHGEGDQALKHIAAALQATARASDIVCRVGGDEFAAILPSCTGEDALGFAARLKSALAGRLADSVGEITVSVGVALGPEHAMSARELIACAETAMMTAKAQGKDRALVFDELAAERPENGPDGRDARSLAHLRMLQSLSRKLNRLTNVTEIGEAIVAELRSLIDYHSCSVFLRDGDRLELIAVRGYLEGRRDALTLRVGQGLTGYVAETGRPLLVPNARESDICLQVPDTEPVDESLAAVPLRHGPRVIGVILMSKLGVGQCDEDDLRLLEVLADHAAVVLENARLYEAMRREAENARGWLEFADALSAADSFEAICREGVARVADLLGIDQCSLWLQDPRSGEYACAASAGHAAPGLDEIVRRRFDAETGDAFLAGRRTPFVVSAAEVRRRLFPADDAVEVGAIACAPLPPGCGVRGWLTLRQPDDDLSAFTEERLRLLDGMAYRLSMALQKTALYREQQVSAYVANALLTFARSLVAAEGALSLSERIVEGTAAILQVPEAELWLQRAPGGEIVAAAVFGMSDADRERALSFQYAPAIGARFVDAPNPFVYRPEDHPDVPTWRETDRVYAIAPFRFECGRMGFLIAGAPPPASAFDELRLKLLAGLADQAKLAISSETGRAPHGPARLPPECPAPTGDEN